MATFPRGTSPFVEGTLRTILKVRRRSRRCLPVSRASRQRRPAATVWWAALAAVLAVLTARPAPAADYAIGADVSFLKQAEDRGVEFRDGDEAGPGLEILRSHGFNWVRLRLFVAPQQLPNDLDYTVALAKAAKDRGFRFLLNFHYSDTWADPGKQFTPAAWVDLDHTGRVARVRDYSRDAVAAFRAAGALPDMVQVGNEVRPGMLWPDGRLPDHWDQFADYFRAGVEGVRAGSGDAGRVPEIMLHYDQGGDRGGLDHFYQKFRSHGLPVDVVGVSYYPWWHGSLLDLRETLFHLATRHRVDVIVVETAYHWRPNGETREHQPMPFPETPGGQRQFLEALNRIVLSVPDGRGRGVFWWEPMVEGGFLRSRGLFDDDNVALPAMGAFDSLTRPRPPGPPGPGGR